MTTIVYTLLVVAHTQSPKEVDPKNPSIMMWWKWCSYLWPMILWWNIIITLVFWLFIDFGDASIWPKSKLILDHLLPVAVSGIDWFLNAIVIEKQHIWS